MKCFFNQLIPFLISGIYLALTMQVSAESLQNALKAAQEGNYISPNFTEVYQAESLFIRTFKGEQSQALQNDWQTQHFTMRTLTVNGTPFTIVQENQNKRTGRGFYVFRQTAGLPIALQAPHSFKDLYTGQIARRLLLEGQYIAAGWNTVPRYGTTKQTDFADLAHLDNTIFQAFGRAFAKQYPTGTIVQLHGFAQKQRKTAIGKMVNLILSDTTIAPYRRVLDIGYCFKTQLASWVIRIYPYGISELGGTQNSNAKDLRERGFTQFFHIELSQRLRKTLRNNKSVRKKLSMCLQLAK